MPSAGREESRRKEGLRRVLKGVRTRQRLTSGEGPTVDARYNVPSRTPEPVTLYAERYLSGSHTRPLTAPSRHHRSWFGSQNDKMVGGGSRLRVSIFTVTRKTGHPSSILSSPSLDEAQLPYPSFVSEVRGRCRSARPLHRCTPTAPLDTHCTAVRPLHCWTPTTPPHAHCTAGRPLHRWTSTAP